jgi:hypothetical protein
MSTAFMSFLGCSLATDALPLFLLHHVEGNVTSFILVKNGIYYVLGGSPQVLSAAKKRTAGRGKVRMTGGFGVWLD